jgi:alkylation response protein AidB-like acyl-CoA dehydrogenase
MMLPRLSSGEWVGANATPRRVQGSDVTRLATSAERDGDATCSPAKSPS